MDLAEVRRSFTEYLKSEKFRTTPERFEVLETVLATDGHFDADALYFKMKNVGSKVSRATVYNTLDLLQDCGLIAKHRFDNGHSRYERTAGRPHHDHLICLDCGEITEFVSDSLAAVQTDICSERGFKVQSSTLQIFGTCARCQTKRPE